MVKNKVGFLVFQEIYFFWLDIKLPELFLFLWEVEQCLGTKTFYWDGCYRGWVSERDSRNQSNQAPVYEEKILRTYMLPETKWEFFLLRFDEFQFISFRLLQHWGVYSFSWSVRYIFLHELFERSPWTKFSCRYSDMAVPLWSQLSCKNVTSNQIWIWFDGLVQTIGCFDFLHSIQ